MIVIVNRLIKLTILFTLDADSSGKSTPSDTKSLPFDEGPNINSLSDYIELLYEGVSDKIKASTLILQLAKNPDNLESLSRNGEC